MSCGYVNLSIGAENAIPRRSGAPEVSAFLNYLATERKVAAATQTQALSALLFLRGQALGMYLG